MQAATVNGHGNDEGPGVRVMPPAVFYTCLTLGIALELLFPSSIPQLNGWFRIIAGLGVAAAGFAFMMAGHEKFKKLGTPVPLNQGTTALVTSGAHGLSRNPMYVGGSLFYLGIGLAVDSVWMLASYAPLGLYLALYVVPREEAYMERRFGQEYLAYRAAVRRWL